MEVISKERKLCSCCMEEHDVWTVKEMECNVFKGKSVNYEAIYEYCDQAEEYFAVGDMISQNDIAMKNAYRTEMNLLTTNQIYEIRKKYGISQSDLSNLLGWGEKTITRYEGHQVQDFAHDSILRKIDSDPDWFLTFLEDNKDKFNEDIYNKYHTTAVLIYEKSQDNYLRKAIWAKYAKYISDMNACGGKRLNIDKVVDVINYYSNSKDVVNLYKVKLMKLLWYADALSFKRRNQSMMGLVYKAQPMGALPIADNYFMQLDGVVYEEIYFEDGVGYHFVPTDKKEYSYITEQDREILDKVIAVLGKDTRKQIVDYMHKEQAYIQTKIGDIIPYQYAKELTIQ